VDDDGLSEFQSKFYPRDLYLDSDLAFYKALGDRKLRIPLRSLLNPFRAYRTIKEMNARLKARNIEGNLVGEGITQGGVIVFDGEGKVRYAYLEETGSELPVVDILSAVRDVSSSVGGAGEKERNAENSEL